MSKSSGVSFNDWLTLARLSNLPTVVSNALVGLVAAAMAPVARFGYPEQPSPEWRRLLDMLGSDGVWPILAVCCFYVMGMMLNDVADASIDARERPNRPIPSDRVARRTAALVGIGLGVAGFALLLPLRRWEPMAWAAALVVAIVGYDFLNKRWPAVVLLMGACRSLVYLLAASISIAVHEPIWWRIVLPFAIIVGIYTIMITVIARMEDNGRLGARKWLALVMPLVILPAVLSVVPLGNNMIWAAIAVMVMLLWLGRAAAFIFAKPPETKEAVMTWISGMCLIDAWFLTLMGWPIAALIAGIGFIATVLAHQRIMGT